MFVGHLGVALAAKKVAPRLPLAALTTAAFGLDVLWPIFLLLGVESVRVSPGITRFTPLDFVHYPWTHSLAMSLAWGVAAGALARAIGGTVRAGMVVGALVVSHWILDLVVHRPDLPLWPGGPMEGFGLWNSIPATLVVEGLILAAGLSVYARVAPPRDRTGAVAFWGLVALVAMLWLAGPFSPPPPSEAAIAIVGLAFVVLVVPWTIWIERHRRTAAILLLALSGSVLSAQASHAPLAVAPTQTAATPAQISMNDAVARARAIVELLAKQDFAAVSARFDATMQMVVPADRLLGIWSGLTQQAGAFVKQTTATPAPGRGGTHVVVVRCEFARGAFDLQFAFDATGLVSGFYTRAVTTAPMTMPAYASPAAYVEEAMTIGAGPRALPGTLTRPKAAGRHPAVVLVHGSGPNDRDETVGANRPFRDLALGLASRGVAVLRYDKRTKTFPTSLVDAGAFTVKEEVLDDVKAAVARLRALPSIDPARIVVIGHSLGGTLAPRIAAADPRLAGLVVMAGATRSLPQAMLEQTRYLAMIDGVVSVDEQAAVTRMGKLGDAVARLRPADASNATLMEGAPASYWLDLRDYDPAASARALTIPMLILQGERDYQVTTTDFEGWKSGLTGRTGVTFKLYPALNHLFIAGAGQSLPSEYGVPGHVSADVITDVAAWIAALPPRK